MIPQTYFTPWQKNKGTLKIQEKPTGNIKEKNKSNVSGINYYHSIIAGMPICTQDDSDYLFASLSGLIVTYNDEIITNTQRMGEVFYDFSKWIITQQDNSPVPKSKRNFIFDTIQQCKINEIEDLWSTKYETKWNVKRELIEQKLKGISMDCTIDAFQKGFLTKFLVSLDWRSITKNDIFKEVFDDINSIIHFDKIVIPKNEQELPLFKTAYDYMEHCILLKLFRDYLHDKGLMYEYAKTCIEQLSLCFLIAPDGITFHTSDNPSFQIQVKERDCEGIIGVFPVSPKICIVQNRSKDNDKYQVRILSSKEVEKYNDYIDQNASEIIVL